jgi:NAD(P)-dependent dehydrogenase (short-subunit alcohol dehydrogenase family)
MSVSHVVTEAAAASAARSWSGSSERRTTVVAIELDPAALACIRSAGWAAQEVAAAVVHLLSDESSAINGATVPVDGGRSVLARDPEASAIPSSAVAG